MKKIEINKLFIVLIIIVPIIIHILYSFNISDVLKFHWGSGELLIYSATILVAYITFKYGGETFLKTELIRVKPYIALEKCLYNHNFNILSIIDESSKQTNPKNKNIKNQYIEYRIDQINIMFIGRNKFLFTKELTDEQIKLIQTNGNKVTPNEDGLLIIKDVKFNVLPLIIENVGLGCALKFNIGIRPIEEDIIINEVPHTVKGINRPAFRLKQTINIKVGETKTLRLLIDNPTEDIDGKYELFFEYSDIYNTSYEQNYMVVIEKNVLKLDFTSDYNVFFNK